MHNIFWKMHIARKSLPMLDGSKGKDGIKFNIGKVFATAGVMESLREQLELEQSQEDEFGMSERYAKAESINFETQPRCGITDGLLESSSVESTLETLQREKAYSFRGELLRCVEKHARGDYGVLGRHDVNVNDECLKYNNSRDPEHIGPWSGRILSKYLLSTDEYIYVITDFMELESVTTIIFPSEY